MKILLDYFFKITSITPTPSASTSFLKQVCLVVKPNGGGLAGQMTLCTTMSQVSAKTDNTEAQQLFNAGMSKVYLLQADDLDLADFLDGVGDFYTLLISSDFSDADVLNLIDTEEVKSYLKVQDILYTSKLTGVAGDDISIEYTGGGTAGAEVVTVDTHAISVQIEDGVSTAQQIADAIEASMAAAALVEVEVDAGDEDDVQAVYSETNLDNGVDAVVGDPDAGLLLGDWKGVVGVSSTDDSFLAAQAAITNRVAFHCKSTVKAKNMCFAFGKMLSNSLNWRNQQYIEMPYADDVDTLGAAEALFDDKESFVISDDEFSNRLALFAAGGKAVVAPYITRNLEIDFQSAALSYISGNQPGYTLKQAALLQDELEKVIASYVAREWIEQGTVAVSLEEGNFVASAEINIAEPKAMWRIFGEMRQTL